MSRLGWGSSRPDYEAFIALRVAFADKARARSKPKKVEPP